MAFQMSPMDKSLFTFLDSSITSLLKNKAAHRVVPRKTS